MPEQRITVWLQRRTDRPYPTLQWIDPETGVRRCRAAKTTDPQEAERRRTDLEYELNHGLAKEPSKMAWDTFRQLYEHEKLAGNRQATRDKAGYVFDSFEELACPPTLGKITERTLSHYSTALREKGLSRATIAAHLAYLRAALRWAAGQRFIPIAPTVVMPKVPKKKNIRKIAAEEFERLIAKASTTEWPAFAEPPAAAWSAYISTAWYTGMRRNEMLDLTWDNATMPRVDFKEGRIWIPAAYNKSDEDQWVPLHPELVEILVGLSDRPAAERTGFLFPFRNAPREVSRKFGKLAKRAGLKITLHDLRRSFGSRYASAVPAPVLQRLMRHADIKTTLAFYTNVDDVLSEAILKA